MYVQQRNVLTPNFSSMNKLLHIGCGQNRKDRTTRGFNNDAWHEIRLDIDPSVSPDVTGTMTNMAAGNLYMSHRCGFTRKVLHGTLQSAGFASVATFARGRAPFFDLWALASKSVRTDEEMRAVAALHFPV